MKSISRPELLKMSYKSPVDLAKMQVLVPWALGIVPRDAVSNNLLGKAVAASPWTPL